MTHTTSYDDPSDPFRLLWQDSNGNESGSWLGRDDEHSWNTLDNWDLHTSGTPTYYFRFGTDQTTYDVYVLVKETGNEITRYYGAKFGYAPTCDEVEANATLSFTLEGDTLTFNPCELVSADPKIQLTSGSAPSTCTLDWDGREWKLNGSTVSGPISMAFNSSNSITVTVNDTSGDSDSSALYYPLDSPSDRAGVITSLVSGSGTYTLSLTSSQLPAGITELTVNLFNTIGAGDHHTLKNR